MFVPYCAIKLLKHVVTVKLNVSYYTLKFLSKYLEILRKKILIILRNTQ